MNPCYIEHGLFITEQDLEDSGFTNARDYLVWRISLDIWIDGELIEPTGLRAEYMTERRSPYGVAGWSAGWFYRFPAKFFEAGHHLFEGEWIYLDGSFSIFRTHTIDVVYPDNPGKH